MVDGLDHLADGHGAAPGVLLGLLGEGVSGTGAGGVGLGLGGELRG